MVYIRLTTFQVHKIKASWPKIDFYDFCLYKDFAKQGMARSCGKATDFRAQIFLGCYWEHGSTFKWSLLIIGEKKFFWTTLMPTKQKLSTNVNSLPSNTFHCPEYIQIHRPNRKHLQAAVHQSFRHEKYSNATKLSKLIWTLKKSNINYKVTWQVFQTIMPYKIGGTRSDLCLSEKLYIISAKDHIINK